MEVVNAFVVVAIVAIISYRLVQVFSLFQGPVEPVGVPVGEPVGEVQGDQGAPRNYRLYDDWDFGEVCIT